jgi:hypothetical protein
MCHFELTSKSAVFSPGLTSNLSVDAELNRGATPYSIAAGFVAVDGSKRL